MAMSRLVLRGAFLADNQPQFFLSSQFKVQAIRATFKPPIQAPAMLSSIPRYSLRPRPPATATTQTGQTAWAAFAPKNQTSDNPKTALGINFIFLFSRLLSFISLFIILLVPDYHASQAFLEESDNLFFTEIAILPVIEEGNAEAVPGIKTAAPGLSG